MQVKYLTPSEFDAKVEGIIGPQGGIDIHPRFYTPSGPVVLGVLVSRNEADQVLDRVVIQVNGKGRITIMHRNEEVKATVDGGKDEPKEEPKEE